MNATVQSEIATPAESMTLQHTLFGRFMLPDTSEHPCQVNDISIDGAVFLSSHVPSPGQTLVAYLEEVGRIEATSGTPVPGGFSVSFSLTGARRDRLDTRLKWLAEKQDGGSIEDRRHARYEPRDSRSQITMQDGREYPCEVIDISLSGAAVKVDVMPSLGSYILLGKMHGRVIRYLGDGVAIEFVKPLERGQLREHIA